MGSSSVVALGMVGLLAVLAPRGGPAFGAAVVVAAGAAVVSLAVTLAATGHRPVLPAAAIGGVGVPVRLALDPQAGLDGVAAVAAAMVLAAFPLAWARASRPGVTAAVGVTGLAGLLVALAAGGLVLLRAGDHGSRWVVGLLLAVGLAELAALLVGRERPELQVAGRVVALGAVGGGLYAVANPPFGPLVALTAVALVLAAGVAGAVLQHVFDLQRGGGSKPGTPVRVLTAVGLGAPCLALLAGFLQT